MPGRDPSLMAQRVARFEHVEERLVLSASPWASLAHHAELDLPTIEETSPAVDVRGDFLLGDVAHHGELMTHLNGAHAATGVSNVHADYGFYGSGQTVVVIDSGIAYDHYALGGGFGAGNRVVGGWDFAENDANPYDDAPAGFHGTHVAGIIGSDNATYLGVAPEVDLVALRVFDDAGNGNFGWVEDALDWVIANQDTFANPITTVNLSLGVPEVNYGDVPSWAAVANGLESKFQALNQAGIFVAVSAGNDFELFNAKGLSYPAVSDWVVPVASANDAGTVMSNFSQRDDHVLVAPGESIVSTVPDELFSFDGVPNDWASASGTSMASPYVAGASVLLREAYAFMGQDSVDQDAIYDALFDTASIINDPITGGAFHFIDVEAALGSIVTDTFANDAQSATAMGMMGDGYSFNELIGQMNDRDYFSFVAEQTGTISFSASATHDLIAQWELIGGGGSVSGDMLSFEVVGGQTYTVGLMTSDGIGHYSVDVQLESSVVDWGVVERNTFNNVAVAGTQWYSITSTRAGLATVEANFANGNAVVLELYDANEQLLAAGTSIDGYSRVDAQVAAGEVILVRVEGNVDVDFNVWNVVGISAQQVDLFGDAGDDVFSVTAGATHNVAINGLTYQFADAGVSQIILQGGGGNDSASVTGTAGNESAVIHVGDATLSGDTFSIQALNVEDVDFFGGGGSDSVDLYDSPSNDIFRATPTYARMDGAGYEHFARDFQAVRGFATAGYDKAILYDSIANDTLTSTPTSSTLTGDGFSISAEAFDKVNAYASSGGNDHAILYDSAANDWYISSPEYAFLKGAGFENFAKYFDQVTAHADAGGYDRAIMYDSGGDDTFVGGATSAYLSGTGFQNLANNFETAKAYASGGNDNAILYDSAGDELFVNTSTYSYLQGSGFANFAKGFEQVTAHADNGGFNRARYFDLVTDDVLYGLSSEATLTRQSGQQTALGFDDVRAFADVGETPTSDVGAVDFVFKQIGDWL